MREFLQTWLALLGICAIGAAMLVSLDLHARRLIRQRREQIDRINRAITDDNARDGVSWPCFGGPADGERHSGTGYLYHDGGHYAFSTDRQRWEWRERRVVA